ncbi:MAG: thiol:disulfide interchange protein DsbA/DsbL [Gammaproteobacteria bacterium]|nr:thiol:disulfide interchange protein DsbA/DsbL [Gammaproteobacteria bacterium]
MKKLMLFILLLLNAISVSAVEYDEGIDYKLVGTSLAAPGNKIEVLEFFWYGCPHCYTFEPYIQSWKKSKPVNVKFVRVPAIFRPDWEVQARVYYALSNMGIIEEHHEKIFNEIHNNKKHLDKKEVIVRFLEKNGVDSKKLLKEYNSFAVDGMVRKSIRKQSAYQIEGVPAIIINGKYLVTGSMAGSYENMIKIINYLIAEESN